MELKTWVTTVEREVLAGMFKDIMSQQVKGSQFYYWTEVAEVEGFVGYECELSYNDKKYKSNGMCGKLVILI